jgi:hypothetical protein
MRRQTPTLRFRACEYPTQSANGGTMKYASGKWRICAAVFVIAIAASCTENQPVSPAVKVATPPAKVVTSLISGPWNAPLFSTCHWSASTSGGVSPYHYAWTVNNSPVGTDSPNLSYTNTVGAFRLLVTVTDQNGDMGSDSKIISNGSTPPC